MEPYDLIASTVRSGRTVDEIEFVVPSAPPATAYLLGRQTRRTRGAVLALHPERGDKSTMLADLSVLADRGVLCMSIDSPTTRHLSAQRDPLGAFEAQLEIATAAFHLIAQIEDVHAHAIAVMGREMGGEVAARLAAQSQAVQAVIATAPLPTRSAFCESSAHGTAAGVRAHHDADELVELIEGLRQHDFIHQIAAATATHWLVQVAADDDRLVPADREHLQTQLPRIVKIATHEATSALNGPRGNYERTQFLQRLI